MLTPRPGELTLDHHRPQAGRGEQIDVEPEAPADSERRRRRGSILQLQEQPALTVIAYRAGAPPGRGALEVPGNRDWMPCITTAFDVRCSMPGRRAMTPYGVGPCHP